MCCFVSVVDSRTDRDFAVASHFARRIDVESVCTLASGSQRGMGPTEGSCPVCFLVPAALVVQKTMG